MRTLEEVIEEKKKLDEEISKLHDKSNKLYREMRDIEQSELKQFEGKCIKFGEDSIIYVKHQYLNDDIIQLNGIRFGIVSNIEYIHIESSEYNSKGNVSLSVDVDIDIKIPLKEFKERTTGDYKDIYEIDYQEFNDECRKLLDNFSSNLSIFSWINLTQTFRD